MSNILFPFSLIDTLEILGKRCQMWMLKYGFYPLSTDYVICYEKKKNIGPWSCVFIEKVRFNAEQTVLGQ